MPRRQVKKNDYEAVGEWLLGFWELHTAWEVSDKSAAEPEPDIAALKALVEIKAGDDFVPRYDEASLINIVIPVCPWTKDEVTQMKSTKAASANYKKELGFVIMGACR